MAAGMSRLGTIISMLYEGGDVRVRQGYLCDMMVVRTGVRYDYFNVI